MGHINEEIIDDLQDENTNLKDAVDDLMVENERLRKTVSDYKKLLEREVKK